MKTLILFASKHGSTMNAAKKIATHVSNFDLIDIKKTKEINLEVYDTIYLGTPIYFGRINNRIAKFIKNNRIVLLQKELKIFTLGLDDKNITKTINNSFDEELLSHAHHLHLGGAYVYEDMSFIERFIVKKVASFNESVDTINDENILKLIQF